MADADEHDDGPVRVSRRIAAPAEALFTVLADPVLHLGLDGSGMLRGAITTDPVTAVGDVFSMRMHYAAHGDYTMHNHVIAFEQDRRIAWEPWWGGRADGQPSPDDDGHPRWGHSWGFELAPDGPDATVVTEVYDCSEALPEDRADMDEGRVWIPAMEQTLARLEAMVVTAARGPDPGE